MRRDRVLPLVRQAPEGRRLHEVAPVHAVGIGVPGNVCLCDPEHAHDLSFDAGFLARLPSGCVLDRLAVVDPTTGDNGRELRLGGVVYE